MAPGFNAQAALETAKALAYPRLVGTAGERRAANFIIQRLKDLSRQVWEEKFGLHITPWHFTRLCLALGLADVILAWVTYHIVPAISLAALVFLLIIELCSSKCWLWLAAQKPRAPRLHSSNIVAELDTPPVGKEAAHIFILAHYDSKSQTISLPLRILALTLSGSATVWLLFWLGWGMISRTAETIPQGYPVHFPFVILIICGILLLIARTGNDSPGAVDNAGSVGIVLELAKVFRETPPAHLRLTFLFTGAEEWGLQGALRYLDRHRAELDRENTYFLNLDGVGIHDGRPVILQANPKSWGKEMQEIARKTGIPLSHLGLLPGLLALSRRYSICGSGI